MASYRSTVPKYATASSRLLITDASLDLVVLDALNHNHDSRICYGGYITCRDRVGCPGVGRCRPRCREESHREAARLICHQGGWLRREWREDILIDKVCLFLLLPWGMRRRLTGMADAAPSISQQCCGRSSRLNCRRKLTDQLCANGRSASPFFIQRGHSS
jgi:hypothetical protein